MKISVWEVLEAAHTKPFGIMPFLPGPGVGGHCIPLDPHYLEWKAREYNFNTHFIALAGEINRSIPDYVVAKAGRVLNEQGVALSRAKILALGVAYKKDIDDWRESPALLVITALKAAGATVTYHDPYVPEVNHDGETWSSVALTPEAIKAADLVVILTDHRNVSYQLIADQAKAILDTRNATKGTVDSPLRGDAPLKLGVIGAGAWGTNIIRTLAELDSLGYVAESVPELLKKAAAISSTAVMLDSYKELLTTDVPAVCIATPAATHFQIACDAMEAGKDVFVEKPLTLELAQAQELVATAKRLGRVLMVDHLLLFQPAVQWIRKALEDGIIGTVYSIHSERLNLGRVRSNENVLWSLGVHDIAVILFLAARQGEPKIVSSSAKSSSKRCGRRLLSSS